jgi:hypothetical protein
VSEEEEAGPTVKGFLMMMVLVGSIACWMISTKIKSFFSSKGERDGKNH